jgi:ribosomal protein L11 methylase PrmA
MVIVTNSQNILEYESTPTYATDDQVLIKEGQFFIDQKAELGTGDNGTDNITDEETSTLLSQIGMKSTTLTDASNKQNEINQLLYEKIQNNPEDKKLYNLVQGNDVYLNQDKVEQIKRIVNNINKYYINRSLQLQNRLKILYTSLIQKGYQPQEIEAAYKFIYSNKFNIKIIGNNITISQN